MMSKVPLQSFLLQGTLMTKERVDAMAGNSVQQKGDL